MTVGDAAEVWAAQLAPATGLDHLEPGTLARARRARRHRRGRRVPLAPGRRAADGAGRRRRSAEGLAVDVPAAPRLEGTASSSSRTLELTWESEPPEGSAMARGALSSGDLFGWREPRPAVRSGGGRRRRGRGLAGGRRADRPRLGPGAAPRGTPRGGRATGRGPRADRDRTAARGHRPRRSQPQRRLHRRPGWTDLRHGPRALRDRPRPSSEGAAARRPARHPRTPDARRPRRPYRPRRRALRADAPTRRGRRGPRLPRAVVRRAATGSSCRSSRSRGSPGTPAGSGRRSPAWAAPSGCVPSSGSRGRSPISPRSCSSCTRRGPGRRATPSRPTRRGRPRWRRRSRTRRPRPAAGVARGQGRHGAGPAHGPARRRRRRLRQDRGGAAGRVQGDPGRQAGRGARADDRARGAAPGDVQPAIRGVPARGPPPVAVRVGEGTGGRPSRASPTGPWTSSSARTGCSRRTCGSRTSGWSSSTRSSGSGWPPRSGSSGSATRWTC